PLRRGQKDTSLRGSTAVPTGRTSITVARHGTGARGRLLSTTDRSTLPWENCSSCPRKKGGRRFANLSATISNSRLRPSRSLQRRTRRYSISLLAPLKHGRPQDSASTLPQHQIHRPAPPHMRSRRAQVAEQFGVGAAGVFQGVGEDRQAVE